MRKFYINLHIDSFFRKFLNEKDKAKLINDFVSELNKPDINFGVLDNIINSLKNDVKIGNINELDHLALISKLYIIKYLAKDKSKNKDLIDRLLSGNYHLLEIKEIEENTKDKYGIYHSVDMQFHIHNIKRVGKLLSDINMDLYKEFYKILSQFTLDKENYDRNIKILEIIHNELIKKKSGIIIPNQDVNILNFKINLLKKLYEHNIDFPAKFLKDDYDTNYLKEYRDSLKKSHDLRIYNDIEPTLNQLINEHQYIIPKPERIKTITKKINEVSSKSYNIGIYLGKLVKNIGFSILAGSALLLIIILVPKFEDKVNILIEQTKILVGNIYDVIYNIFKTFASFINFTPKFEEAEKEYYKKKTVPDGISKENFEELLLLAKIKRENKLKESISTKLEEDYKEDFEKIIYNIKREDKLQENEKLDKKIIKESYLTNQLLPITLTTASTLGISYVVYKNFLEKQNIFVDLSDNIKTFINNQPDYTKLLNQPIFNYYNKEQISNTPTYDQQNFTIKLDNNTNKQHLYNDFYEN